jgi:hypothetical protein
MPVDDETSFNSSDSSNSSAEGDKKKIVKDEDPKNNQLFVSFYYDIN